LAAAGISTRRAVPLLSLSAASSGEPTVPWIRAGLVSPVSPGGRGGGVRAVGLGVYDWVEPWRNG
jgi:hypothetical protein